MIRSEQGGSSVGAPGAREWGTGGNATPVSLGTAPASGPAAGKHQLLSEMIPGPTGAEGAAMQPWGGPAGANAWDNLGTAPANWPWASMSQGYDAFGYPPNSYFSGATSAGVGGWGGWPANDWAASSPWPQLYSAGLEAGGANTWKEEGRLRTDEPASPTCVSKFLQSPTSLLKEFACKGPDTPATTAGHNSMLRSPTDAEERDEDLGTPVEKMLFAGERGLANEGREKAIESLGPESLLFLSPPGLS